MRNKKITPIKEKKTNLKKEIMVKIKKEEIRMKPKWYFVVGSLLMTTGLIATSIVAIFLINLLLFFLRKRGPGIMRLELMVTTFPWWISLLALFSIIVGIWFLKKYDFSYKKNFLLIVVSFIVSIIIAGWLIDYFGFNETWLRHGPMRRFYQQLERGNNYFPKGRRGGGRYFNFK